MKNFTTACAFLILIAIIIGQNISHGRQGAVLSYVTGWHGIENRSNRQPHAPKLRMIVFNGVRCIIVREIFDEWDSSFYQGAPGISLSCDWNTAPKREKPDTD